ncbi:aquaporin [Candidatus Marsarchaeota archaeon]|jgi:MIP family channel proteins|nr:aquaporin [Candidatus Marsarchaeota archaeon]
MKGVLKKSLAEMLGTYIFVLFGPGSIVAFIAAFGATLSPSTLFFAAVTFGLGIAIAIIMIANISGGHVNPAVTIGLFISGKFEGKLVLPYIASQLVGAVLASGTVGVLFSYSIANKVLFGATVPGVMGPWPAFLGELIMTFFFLWVILTITSKSKNTAINAAVIGTYVTIMIFILATISGGSINPARSFGPAVLSGILFKAGYYQWIYWVAPILGGALGALAWKYMYNDKSKIHL